jgi:hypothetical protein
VNRLKIRSGEEGFVIALAMIAILVMTFFLLTGAITSTTAVKVSGNYSKSVGTFNIAEVGVAKARPMIEGQDFSSLLTTYNGKYMISPAPFGIGTYEVTVGNDANDSGGATSDTNGIIKITSVGRTPQGAKVTIDTYVQQISSMYPKSFPPTNVGCTTPPCGAASLLCGTNADVSGSGIDGQDHGYPPNNCKGSACDTPATPSTNYDVIGQGTVSYTGCTGPNCYLANAGASSGCSSWQTLYNQWSSASANGSSVILINGTSYDFGNSTCATPKVYLIANGGADITFKGYA